MTIKIIRRATALLLALCILVSICAAQSFPPAYSSASSYAVGDQVQLAGNVLRCTHAVPPGGFKYDDWELWEVRANTVLMAGSGQTFPTLQLAWQYAENARIAGGIYLHIYISTAKGSLTDVFPTSYSLDSPSGQNISIIGDNRTKINLNFTTGGFTLDSGHSFGEIYGVTIRGSSGSGIKVTGNSTLTDIVDSYITGFPIGIDAESGGCVNAENTVTISNFSSAVQALTQGRVILASGFAISGNLAANSADLYEAFDGYIDAQNCTLTSANYGLIATQGGVINVQGATIYDNFVGMELTMHAHVNFEQGALFKNTTHNTSLDIYVTTGSTVDGTGSSAVDGNNTIGTNDGSYIY